ncbi:glycosyltransferase [Granulicella sp. 5B5]|uniref:CgeB family protein n=1 Tax=Granulicella sp. 5B5 TaxID=1617967 RepID=UPI0015F63379|nr:glycosyltransferase [Granulicella sp. 5B5]QMV18015.1 glycosyltransferase [Granulicella sp. 5B5]
MKILYAGQLSANDSALYRLWALERLGHTVVPLNSYGYQPQSALLRKLVHRAQVGPWVTRLNHDVLAMAERERPDVFWADKMLGLRSQTLVKLRKLGIASVSYMIDNAFGPRRDPGWRLYMQCIPEFDLHVVQRDRNLADYKAWGARDVLKIQTAYEPTIHFPAEGEDYVARDATRSRGVSFIGTAYDDRPEFLTQLWREGLPVVISGDSQWHERLEPDVAAALYTGGELYGAAYRKAIWDAKINLSFLTHSNQDEFVHKSFEIAACGGFLLAERSEGHLARFVEDEEAVFFTGYEECAAKIRQYLPDVAARGRIAAAGRARAGRDGYGNDAQMAKVVERVRPLIERA